MFHAVDRLLARRRVSAFESAAAPDEALLLAIAILRHAGARITRYDMEAGELEARLTRWARERIVRVRAAGEPPATRVTVEVDGSSGRFLIRLLRAELRRPRKE